MQKNLSIRWEQNTRHIDTDIFTVAVPLLMRCCCFYPILDHMDAALGHGGRHQLKAKAALAATWASDKAYAMSQGRSSCRCYWRWQWRPYWCIWCISRCQGMQVVWILLCRFFGAESRCWWWWWCDAVMLVLILVAVMLVLIGTVADLDSCHAYNFWPLNWAHWQEGPGQRMTR